MKKNLLILLLLFMLYPGIAQTILFGTTINGGSNSTGTLFNYQPATSTQHIIRNLDSYIGSPTNNNFIQGADGKLYSMTTYGGTNGYGAIFSLDPLTANFTDLYDFNNNAGANPFGSLVQLPSGLLYGLTSLGGANGFGVIFSFDPLTSTYTDLYDFGSTGGEQPYGSLIQASDGKLYGMTLGGGLHSDGAIFSFDPSTLGYTDIHDFTGADGEQPNGSLMQAADGKLYGLAAYGGAAGDGVIFSIDTTSAHNYLDIHDFNGTSGLNPFSSLLQGSGGMLYGLTPNGGANQYGVLFSIDTTAAHVYTDLYDFNPVTGSNPYGNLILGTDGNLYGSASGGGANDYGVIFSFNTATAVYLDEYDFNNGQTPYSGLIQLSSGLLYGMTIGGGTAGLGVIYSFNAAGAIYSVVENFGANQNGSHAAAGMVLASDGNLYGMTIDGGSYGAGVIYKIDTATLNYSVVYNFDGSHGSNPYGSLLQATDGKFYGMTSEGGTNYHNYSGVLFSFDPVALVYTDLYEFDDSSAGSPTGSLLQASDGKLYGMTTGSSTPSNGNIFSFDPIADTYTNLYEFIPVTGFYPNGSLMQATDGKLYGLTLYGGANNYGSLFSFDQNSLTFVDLYDFNDVPGSGGNPFGSLTQAGNGKLYGLSSGFGNSGLHSTLFSFDPVATVFAALQDLGSGEPKGNLLLVSDSILYGTTDMGGAGTEGNVFSYNLHSSAFADLLDFNGTNGSNTAEGSALIALDVPVNLPLTLLDFFGTLKPDNTILLQWQTAQEQNTSFFGVERSPDGKTFSTLGKVAAAGNSNMDLSYYYLDADPLPGNNFYRLDMVDLDGKHQYSQVLVIVTGLQGNSLQILSNPFTSAVGVKLSLSTPDKVDLLLTDVLGRIIIRQSYNLFQGINFMMLYPPSSTQPGPYMLNISGNSIHQTVKLIKE